MYFCSTHELVLVKLSVELLRLKILPRKGRKMLLRRKYRINILTLNDPLGRMIDANAAIAYYEYTPTAHGSRHMSRMCMTCH